MIYLKTLFMHSDWKPVKNTFLELFPEEYAEVKQYEELFKEMVFKSKELSNVDPIVHNTIKLELVHPMHEDEKDFYSFSIYDNEKNLVASQNFPLNSWLNSNINVDTGVHFSNEHIISYVLWDIFYSAIPEEQYDAIGFIEKAVNNKKEPLH
jgi:hypothetical protein